MSDLAETDAVTNRRGNSSKPGVPHRGWRCVDIEDHGAPGPVCEMRESQTIRYIHVMKHPYIPGTLACGCVCAGHMEGDFAAMIRSPAAAPILVMTCGTPASAGKRSALSL